MMFLSVSSRNICSLDSPEYPDLRAPRQQVEPTYVSLKRETVARLSPSKRMPPELRVWTAELANYLLEVAPGLEIRDVVA